MPSPTLSELRGWIKEGNRKFTIEDETHFCNPEFLAEVIDCKSIFDQLEPEELRNARTRSNPFETIRGVFFLNRAAMKMANMDAVFDFMFTDPKSEDGVTEYTDISCIRFELGLLFLEFSTGSQRAAVLCGRLRWPRWLLRVRLMEEEMGIQRLRLHLEGVERFQTGGLFRRPEREFRTPLRYNRSTSRVHQDVGSKLVNTAVGVNGVEGDGDVYKSENILEFKRFVFSQTEGRGVHLMMADGVSSPWYWRGLNLEAVFTIRSTMSGVRCWRPGEHPRSSLQAALPVPVPGGVVYRPTRWPFRVQTFRRLHPIQCWSSLLNVSRV